METLNKHTTQQPSKNDLLILGSGPAGLTAGIYAGRAGLNTKIIAGRERGGQLTGSSKVENFPGFPDGINGLELMDRTIKQAELSGADIIYQDATSVDLTSTPKWIQTENGDKYEAEQILIATGSTPKRLGIKGEQKFWGRGVSTCATCDGPLYKDKDVVVVGGGNNAFHEALHLARMGAKVKLVHRREEFKADETLQEELFSHPNIEILTNSELSSIQGEETVKSVSILAKDQEDEKQIKTDGVFIAIGTVPNTDLFSNQLELDEAGHILTDQNLKTSTDKVYAAGDARDSRYKQAITAAAEGAMAVMNLK
ncbi:thioredoxin-disulfide reductase [Candidatus Dojkabacteria bacterium]|nr:thioredoxin-disulfide reductase [Candidatus Dojkabacteria bacterium]